MFKVISLLTFLISAGAVAAPNQAQYCYCIDKTICSGSSQPGGKCYRGPGGSLYAGPGGNCYQGPGGKLYAGPGGDYYAGPGGELFAGPGGNCYQGPGGRCQGGLHSPNCPAVCDTSCRYLRDRVRRYLSR